MFKKLQQYALSTLLIALTCSGTSLHALPEITAQQVELAAALMRGPCSALEVQLRGDRSKSAHFTKMLIYAVRCTHDYLVIQNHPHDFKNYYPHSRMLNNGIHGISELAGFFDKLLRNDAGRTYLAINREISTGKALVVKGMLPALESAIALYLTLYDGQSQEMQKKRFAAQAALSIIPEMQSFLNANPDTDERTMALTMIIIDVLYAIYEVKKEDSEFNA